MVRLAFVLALLAFAVATAASAEIYRWTDAEGNLHFAQDLSQVPREYRSQVQKQAPSGSGGAVQTYSPPASVGPNPGPRSDQPIRIPFERQGTLMWVTATVNDRHQLPFLIDTGASGVSLPSDAVAKLGIRIRPDTPRVTVGTANGITRVPLVELDSVQLGSARVEGLMATVNPTMNVGLLGGAFFNNYRYSVDTAAGVITLVPNDGVRGGESAEQWRERFAALRDSIDRLEAYLADRELARPGRRQELEANLAALHEELRNLEQEANRAGVPQAWRR